MKNSAFTIMAGFVLLTSAEAGTTTYTAPEPVDPVGLWQWFTGGSAGYVSDLNEALYTLHLGAKYQQSNSSGSHALYLEVGYTQDDANYSYAPPPMMTGAGVESGNLGLDMIPITINYRYQAPLSERWDYYVGLGLGVVLLDSQSEWNWSRPVAPPLNQGGGRSSQSDTQFYGHIFAGLAYEVSDSFEIFGGVRYLFMNDVDIEVNVRGAEDYSAGINGDVLFELGLRYYF